MDNYNNLAAAKVSDLADYKACVGAMYKSFSKGLLTQSPLILMSKALILAAQARGAHPV
jgi:hypothetical protein